MVLVHAVEWGGRTGLAVSRYCQLESAEAGPACREPDDYLAEQRWFTVGEVRDLDIIPSQLRTIGLVLEDLAPWLPARLS